MDSWTQFPDPIDPLDFSKQYCRNRSVSIDMLADTQ